MAETCPMAWASAQTALGLLTVAASDRGLARVELRVSNAFSAHGTPGQTGARDQICAAALEQIGAYLAGQHRVLDLPVDLSSGTGFQQLVWKASQQIPFGDLRTYGDLAAMVGSPRAARAVGAALGANPVLLVVPCHRIIRANGYIGGFTAGLALKRELLRLEGHALMGDAIQAATPACAQPSRLL